MHGSCVCGAVEFEVDGPIRDGIACHCTQCRKMSGHFWVASSVPMDRFRLTRDDGLEWYAASDQAARGFCKRCGSFLLWKPVGEDRMGFALGAIDGPTGVGIAKHIFTEDAGDYYAPEGPPPAPGRPARPFARIVPLRRSRVHPAAARRRHGACHCSAVPKALGPFRGLVRHRRSERHLRGARNAGGVHESPAGAQRGLLHPLRIEPLFPSGRAGSRSRPGQWTGRRAFASTATSSSQDKGDYYRLDDGLPQFTRWD